MHHVARTRQQRNAKVLILCEFPTLSGGERSMLGTLDTVCRAGFDVHLAGPPDGPLASAVAALGVPLTAFDLRDSDGQSGSLPRRREALAECLTRFRPDLLHANSLAMGRLAGPVAAAVGIPSLGHLRDIIRLSRQAIADLNRNTRLLAVSEATRRFHVGAGLAPEKTFVLYNGVDLAAFRPRQPTGYLHRERGIPSETPLIGTIGQICLRKGHDVLLDAACRLDASADPVAARPHWLFVGERWSDKAESREFERQLHDRAERLAGRVHFLGSRDDVPDLLGELTLLVHPARQEPLGRVLLESAAAGVPVVATDVGGTHEILPPDSGSALLVAPDDAEGLARAIAELLIDPERRKAMAAAARRRAEEHFDVARAAVALAEHYRAVVHDG